MKSRKAKHSHEEKLLTEAELELMSPLWKLEEATVHEVQALVERPLAYTTVSTILRILESKRLVASRKVGRTHRYRPLISRAAYETKSLHHLITKVFDGSALPLVRTLLQSQSLSSEEVAELQRLLKSSGGAP